MSDLITPEQAGVRNDLQNWAAAEFIISLMLKDPAQAFQDIGELGMLAATEEDEWSQILGVARFELIDAALDFNIPFFEAMNSNFVGYRNIRCATGLKIAAARMRPEGVFGDAELIQRFDDRDFTFSSS